MTKPNLLVKNISATEIEVSTDVLAKDVYLIGDTHFSDNFFDLMPNTKKRINLSKPLEKIDIMSLWDTKNSTESKEKASHIVLLCEAFSLDIV